MKVIRSCAIFWIQQPSTYLLGLLLKLLNGSLVNATAFVDQMPSGGGLAGVYVANNHNVDVNLFLGHDD